MKPHLALLSLLFASTLHAQSTPPSAPMSFDEAVAQSKEQKRCIQNESGQLFRVSNDKGPEQCSVDTGWVTGPVVARRINSDESKKAKWQVTSCRCQHE